MLLVDDGVDAGGAFLACIGALVLSGVAQSDWSTEPPLRQTDNSASKAAI